MDDTAAVDGSGDDDDWDDDGFTDVVVDVGAMFVPLLTDNVLECFCNCSVGGIRRIFEQ